MSLSLGLFGGRRSGSRGNNRILAIAAVYFEGRGREEVEGGYQHILELRMWSPSLIPEIRCRCFGASVRGQARLKQAPLVHPRPTTPRLQPATSIIAARPPGQLHLRQRPPMRQVDAFCDGYGRLYGQAPAA